MMTDMEKLTAMLNRRWVVELAKQDAGTWDLRAWLMSDNKTQVYCSMGQSHTLRKLLDAAAVALARAERKYRLSLLLRDDLHADTIAHHNRIISEMDQIIAAAELMEW
jgi:hypothetical protein